MKDVQNHPDTREMPIDRVGVCDLKYPIIVMDRENRQQSTTARISMSVNLPREFKGTHMSRFIEILNSHRGEITMRTLPMILHELKHRLDAQSAHIEVEFPYFLERCVPVSGARALMDYECVFTGEVNGGTADFILGVRIPVTSLCPCSKAISEYGAHNQRGYVTVEIRSRPGQDMTPELVWIEELVEWAEASASAPLYPLLKREDERHVTMQAYDNPAFVEDVVRDVAVLLQKDQRISWFRVHALNQESIHNHNAFAQIAWSRP
jgi:GTP cyclohydrolase IB